MGHLWRWLGLPLPRSRPHHQKLGVVVPKGGTMSIVGKHETLVAMAMTNEDGVTVQLPWQLQVTTAQGTTIVRGVVEMVCVCESAPNPVREESDRAVLAQMLLEPELKVAKERTVLLLGSTSSPLSGLRESA